MPRISTFYGIAIYMYFHDHPPPHFHAIYGEFEATINIHTNQIEQGELPKRAKRLVEEWAEEHNEELTENWNRARDGEALNNIDPLK